MNKNHPLKDALYERYIRNLNFDTNHHSLDQKGVTGINDMPFPHIFDLQDIRHREDIHKLCVNETSTTSNCITT